MKKILLFGAGKSATVLIHYLLQQAQIENWEVTVADADHFVVQHKLAGYKRGRAVSFPVENETERTKYIQEADLVLSLLPPALHVLVAADCLVYEKNLITASYVDASVKSLQKEIEDKGLLFLCEMGLDPGIDHMSAKKMIDAVHADGGTITAFRSHCGGLVAPESDDNPWHYKISWNPRNIVLAGKAGAVYKEEGQVVQLSYEDLFAAKRFVSVPGLEVLCWYPNRDSLHYAALYGLDRCPTFIRTTLRHPDFIYGWKNLIELKLTDETVFYDTNGVTLMDFFKKHMDRTGFSTWLEQKMQQQLDASKNLLESLLNLAELQETAKEEEKEEIDELMLINEKGNLEELRLDDLKLNAAATVAHHMHEANITLKQLFYLGMDDAQTAINKGRCSAADVLQFALEKKLALQQGDKDMVVMLHELEYEKENRTYEKRSALVVKGEDQQHTAMAKTVGLPMGIAAKLILNGTITVKGLQIPLNKEIYEPVLEELHRQGIRFTEEDNETT